MLAAAKINLDLRITGRRDDGYHLLDSIVVFTEAGDELTAKKSDKLSMTIEGPFADGLSDTDNLVLKAARLICEKAGVEPGLAFNLQKNLPVSSGIGGGSSDAAAALKLCNENLNIYFDEVTLDQIALEIGADVPVCLRSKASRMSGIGEEISPIELKSDLYMLLVNPGISVSTPEVFNRYHALKLPFEEKRTENVDQIHLPLMIDHLISSTNSLQKAACEQHTEIKTLLNVLEETEGVLFSRMSGSGATCFALYEGKIPCTKAAKKVREKFSSWWVEETRLLQ